MIKIGTKGKLRPDWRLAGTPPSGSGGLCAERGDRGRGEEEEDEGSPPSSSSDTSDIAGSLELKERNSV